MPYFVETSVLLSRRYPTAPPQRSAMTVTAHAVHSTPAVRRKAKRRLSLPVPHMTAESTTAASRNTAPSTMPAMVAPFMTSPVETPAVVTFCAMQRKKSMAAHKKAK